MHVEGSCRALAVRACTNLSKLTFGNIRDGLVVGSSILPGTFDGHQVSKVVNVKVIGGNKVRITTEPVLITDITHNYQTNVFELQDTKDEEPPSEDVINLMCHAIKVILGLTTENAVFRT